MRTFAVLLTGMMLSIVYPAAARDRVESTIDLQRYCRSSESSDSFRVCIAFMREAVLKLDYLGEATGRSYYCAPGGHDFRRYAEIFNDWAANNQKRRGEPAVLGVVAALANAFPCDERRTNGQQAESP